MTIKKRIISNFSKAATTYELAADLQAKVAYDVATRLDQVDPHSVLELGCGTGLLSQYLPRLFPDANIWVTDVSQSMLSVCQQRLCQHSAIKIACLDAEDMILQQSFDLIVSSMMFHWFNDVVSSIQKMMLHLNRKGKIVFSMLGNNSLLEWKHISSQLGLPNATPIFPEIEKIKVLLPKFTFEVRSLKKTYANGHAFLKNLKSLGANTARYNSKPIKSSEMRALLRYLNQEVTMSYEVIYAEFQRR